MVAIDAIVRSALQSVDLDLLPLNLGLSSYPSRLLFEEA